MAGTWVKLVASEQVGRVTNEFTKIIGASFESHPMNHMTKAEVNRRFEIVARIFETLRGDLKWGLEKILDKLPMYLGDELNGVEWKPDARSIWTPPTLGEPGDPQ